MVSRESGFTLIEVVIAIILLTVGVLGMAAATARVTGMLSRGDRAATAAVYTQERLERLRALARATPACASLSNGSETREGKYRLSWSVSAATGPRTRQVQLVVAYPGVGRYRADSLETSVECR